MSGALTAHVAELHAPAALGSVVDFAPVDRSSSVWIVLGERGRLARADLSSGAWERLDDVRLPPEEVGDRRRRSPTPRLHVSATGAFVAVVDDYGRHGTVHRVGQGTTMELDGGDYHEGLVPFSFAFVERDGRTVAIHRTAWNRLDASDAAAGGLLTRRGPTTCECGEPPPDHYLDYFHGRLLVSPDGSLVVDDGWVWHPMGMPVAWSVDAWLGGNVWESEDGRSVLTLCQRGYYWDHGMCWLDASRVAVEGIGDDDGSMIDGARIFVANEATAESAGRRWRDAREAMSFPGPRGTFLGDGRLLFSSTDEGLDVWDPSDGALVGHIDDFRPRGRHPVSGELVEAGGSILRAATVGVRR